MRCFHCPHCRKCTLRYEKHSYLFNRCISANNIGLYYLFTCVELLNTSIVFWAVLVTFEDRIDTDLVFFIFYLATAIGHEFLYIKKFCQLTETMVKGETMHERENKLKLHYKMEKQLSMMDRMQGKQPVIINPFDKGIFLNVIEFFLPSFPCLTKTSRINVQMGEDLMAPRKLKSKSVSIRSNSNASLEEIEMTNTTIDIDEEAKLDSERDSMVFN
mmetsp:Transcript_41141/g.30256  ORF Transcript_41141/g.30256 Transcript_41141/m.30256 type:complete len:216 (+) Transcript_41141:637-1284(+)